jgi:hypothetical protein
MSKVIASKLGEIVFPSVRGDYMRRSQWSSMWNAIRIAMGTSSFPGARPYRSPCVEEPWQTSRRVRDFERAIRVARKPSRSALLSSTIALVLAAGYANSGQSQTISTANPAAAAAPSGGPSLAKSVARSLLEALMLPSDAKPISDVPRSLSMRFAGSTPATPNLVELARTYGLAGAPQAVLDAIRPPAVMRPSGSGSAGHHAPGQPEIETSWYVTFEARPSAGVQSETLSLATIAAPGGGTLLRAEAQVVWTSERPAAERVPAGVSSIELTRRSVDRQISLRRTISAAHQVKPIVTVIDRLPIVQPGTTACPDARVGPTLIITFRGPAHEALAQAVQRAGGEVANCNPMYFSVRGHEEDPLAQGATVIALIDRMLGIRGLPPHRARSASSEGRIALARYGLAIEPAGLRLNHDADLERLKVEVSRTAVRQDRRFALEGLSGSPRWSPEMWRGRRLATGLPRNLIYKLGYVHG